MRAIYQRPNPLTTVGLSVLVVIAFVTHRFLMQVSVAVMLVAMLALYTLPAKRWPTVVYNLSVLFAFIFLFSPVDLAVRNGKEWRIGVVQVRHTANRKVAQKKAEDKGLIQNVDLVLYDWRAPFLGPYWALLITVPSEHQIYTPL